MALLDVRKEVSFARKVQLPILGVVENMSGFVCPCCSKKSHIFRATTGGAQRLCAELALPFLGALPIDEELLQCCERGRSFLKFAQREGVGAGTRMALLNAVKQIVTRVAKAKGKAVEGYLERIDAKETALARKGAKRKRKRKSFASANLAMPSYDGDGDADANGDARAAESDSASTDSSEEFSVAKAAEMEKKEAECKDADEDEHDIEEMAVRKNMERLDEDTNEFLLDID